MEIGQYVDPAEEYEALAERCAADSGYRDCTSGAHMMAVARFDMHPDNRASIDADPAAFDARVHAYCYAHAMRAVPEE
jgi:hypothetical protein